MSNELTVSEGYLDAKSLQHYGEVVRHSLACAVCKHIRAKEINLARARDLKSLGEISSEYSLPESILRKHFENHFIVSEKVNYLLSQREGTQSQGKDIIHKIFEGETDLLEGISSVNKSRAARIAFFTERLAVLQTRSDTMGEEFDDMDKQEYIQLSKLLNDVEKEVVRAYQIIDKKIFPADSGELSKAVLNYKLGVLSKFVDEISSVLHEFAEKSSEYAQMVSEIRSVLASRVNSIEAEILKSGPDISSGI